MIHGKHGSQLEPHFYLKVGQEHKYSQSLNTGFVIIHIQKLSTNCFPEWTFSFRVKWWHQFTVNYICE